MTATAVEAVPCVSCGGERFEILLEGLRDAHGATDERFALARCGACGTVALRPRPTREAIGVYYPDDYRPYGAAAGPVSAARRVLRRLTLLVRAASFAPARLRHRPPERHPAPAANRNRLLDVGTGSGDYVRRMARLGWDVRGIEPSPRAAAMAERSAGLRPGAIVVGQAETANLADGAFDLVTMLHVVEHLHDPLVVLRQVRGWLAEGGRLLLCCPNVGSLESRVFGRRWVGLDPPRHLTHFTPETLTALLERAGFRVLKIAGEEQSFTLAASLWTVLGRAADGFPRPPQGLHHGLAPVAGLALLAGRPASMIVEAVPREPQRT